MYKKLETIYYITIDWEPEIDTNMEGYKVI